MISPVKNKGYAAIDNDIMCRICHDSITTRVSSTSDIIGEPKVLNSIFQHIVHEANHN